MKYIPFCQCFFFFCFLFAGCANYPSSIHHHSLKIDDLEDAYKEAESLHARGDLQGSLRIYEEIIKVDQGYPITTDINGNDPENHFFSTLYHKDHYDMYYSNLFSGAYLGAGYLRYKTGDYKGSIERIAEAFRIYETTRDLDGQAFCLAMQSHVLFVQGEYVAALQKEHEGMKISRNIPQLKEMIRNLEEQKKLSFRHGDIRTAIERVRLFANVP